MDEGQGSYLSSGNYVGEAAERLTHIVEAMRAISYQGDPQRVVAEYSARIRNIMPTDGFLSLSRRNLAAPYFRITRSSLWTKQVNPWKELDRLPIMEGGILSELIYGDEPRLINDFQVAEDDPAAEYFEGMQSIMASPLYDQGIGKNMVVMMRREAGAFDPEQLPEFVWVSNLFGRATMNLVLHQQLQEAYDNVDRELKVVADIQRSILPQKLPKIPTLDVATFYQTSQRAGGDYYDIFELPDNKWGILIADVTGHGTPAAVLMAITSTIAHESCVNLRHAGEFLTHLNNRLVARYTIETSAFVTAFYGVYDPATRSMEYACAGHNPPRVKNCQTGQLSSLDRVGGLPLGIAPAIEYPVSHVSFVPGDQIVLYTDGITEAMNADGEMFGTERLDAAIENCHLTASGLIESVVNTNRNFTRNLPPADDQTMLVAKVS